MKPHTTNLFALFFGSLFTQAGVLSLLHQSEAITPTLSATIGLALGAFAVSIVVTLLGTTLRTEGEENQPAADESQLDQGVLGAP